jgi:dihydrofolate reductase/thymidylate synthase
MLRRHFASLPRSSSALTGRITCPALSTHRRPPYSPAIFPLIPFIFPNFSQFRFSPLEFRPFVRSMSTSPSVPVIPPVLRDFSIVVAATRLGAIGLNNDLPWGRALTRDLANYKRITSETADPNKMNAVIFGRKTWESLPVKAKPLKGRLNVVITQSPSVIDSASSLADTLCFPSFRSALEALSSPPHTEKVEKLFLVGGAGLIASSTNLPQCKSIFLTEVLKEFPSDVKIAPINRSLFDLVESSELLIDNDVPFQFLRFDRRAVHEERQYLDLVDRVISTGTVKGDRTGTGTISIFGAQMRFDLRKSFPLLTTKRVFWRGVLEELLWLVRGATDSKQLAEKKVHIWDDNGSREFLDKLGFQSREVGDLGPVYGFQWRHFGAQYVDCRSDYRGQGVDQLAQIIETIKKNPNDRRILMSAWNPVDIPKMALPPCHIMCQFYVANGELSCQMYQRSCDLGLGVPFNIASYSLLTCMIAHVCGLKPGDFVHTLGDAHVYSNHVEPLRVQLEREPKPFPTLKIKRDVKSIDEFTADDFLLENYQCHEAIKMQMAV